MIIINIKNKNNNNYYSNNNNDNYNNYSNNCDGVLVALLALQPINANYSCRMQDFYQLYPTPPLSESTAVPQYPNNKHDNPNSPETPILALE